MRAAGRTEKPQGSRSPLGVFSVPPRAFQPSGPPLRKRSRIRTEIRTCPSEPHRPKPVRRGDCPEHPEVLSSRPCLSPDRLPGSTPAASSFPSTSLPSFPVRFTPEFPRSCPHRISSLQFSQCGTPRGAPQASTPIGFRDTQFVFASGPEGELLHLFDRFPDIRDLCLGVHLKVFRQHRPDSTFEFHRIEDSLVHVAEPQRHWHSGTLSGPKAGYLTPHHGHTPSWPSSYTEMTILPLA
jgi:hypothetical protein